MGCLNYRRPLEQEENKRRMLKETQILYINRRLAVMRKRKLVLEDELEEMVGQPQPVAFHKVMALNSWIRELKTKLENDDTEIKRLEMERTAWEAT